MTSQTHPELSETLLERMLIERAGAGAPPDLVRAIATAVESTSQRTSGLLGTGRQPWRFRSMPVLLRFSTAAVIAVLAVGGAFYLSRPSQSAVGGPSPTPGAIATPSAPGNPSASPSSSAAKPRAASWTPTGSMVTPRAAFTATLLPDGKVLVAGGQNGSQGQATASAELYDPASGSWTATGSMVAARFSHTATLLPDGKVLVVGGTTRKTYPDGSSTDQDLASAELYDPGTGTWTATGSMGTPRSFFTATLLADGKVLVAGGGGPGGPGGILASAELYDPGTGSWTATGTMGTPRWFHTATVLPDGKVLVTGGVDHSGVWGPVLASAELYDPGTGTWTATGSMSTPRSDFTATLLANGKVLVAGGGDTLAELYDPGSGIWTRTGSPVTNVAVKATLLPDGRVLVIGLFGTISQPDRTSDELYDPASGTWTVAGGKSTPPYRNGFTATLLPDGRVLVAGGFSDPQRASFLASAELYDPGSRQ